MFCIGPHKINTPSVLAPMAGVSDLPFRILCANQGAGLVVNEMVTADTRLWHSNKSKYRLAFANSDIGPLKSRYRGPLSIQIAGSDPEQLSEAAKACVQHGADIVDINMGCPAKKVCNKAAGSALLQNERLVDEILTRIVKAVDVPVTLKIRTGTNPQNKNGVTIARIAEQAGISALTVHGRTRACKFKGEAEYETIANIVSAVDLPVIANGDIDSANKARTVLAQTGAKAVMIGRAAQGNPWIFKQINALLDNNQVKSVPSLSEIRATVVQHLSAIHDFYGDFLGARISRKHVGWYLKHLNQFVDESTQRDWQKQFNQLTQLKEQLEAIQSIFDRMNHLEDHAA